MAVAARQENREYYAPVTRVYSYGSTAAAVQPAYRPEPVSTPEEQTMPTVRKKTRPAVSPLKRVMAVACVCAAAAMLLFVMVRYARIADEYAVVNQLNDKIEAAKLNLAALNVELQLAVSLEDAEATAKAMGMSYPCADQIHCMGEPLASDAQAMAAAADAADTAVMATAADAEDPTGTNLNNGDGQSLLPQNVG